MAVCTTHYYSQEEEGYQTTAAYATSTTNTYHPRSNQALCGTHKSCMEDESLFQSRPHTLERFLSCSSLPDDFTWYLNNVLIVAF